MGVGPGVILFTSTSKAEADIDFEGIYKFKDGAFVYEQHYEYDKSDLFLMEDSMPGSDDNQRTTNAEFLFGLLKDYDFSLNDPAKPYQKQSDGFQRVGISGNGCFDLFYHVTPKLALKTGATFVFAPFKSKANDYKFADKADGSDYKSFVESKPKSNYFGYGIILGIVLGTDFCINLVQNKS